MNASPASSHSQEEKRVQKQISTPRQQLARAHQKSNHNVLKGYLMTGTTGLLSDAETSGGKHKQKNADNIEIPAKDNNITGGNSMDVLSYKLKNYLLLLAINQVLKPNGTEFKTMCIKIT